MAKNTAETTEFEEDVIVTEEEDIVENADDDENEAEFSEEADGEEAEAGNEIKEEEKSNAKAEEKPWKNDQNTEHARLRREAERKAEIEQARNEAIIEALGGENPYTNEKMVDGEDVKEYLTMKALEKSGKDPVIDYGRFLKDKAKEERKAAQAQASQEEWMIKDREDFTSKHPDVKLDELVDDEMFQTFAVGKVGKMPMVQIYADYKAFEKRHEERAKKTAHQILANREASPGKMSTAKADGDGFFTREQVAKMSQAEVNKNFDAIEKSMEKWK